MDSIKALGLKQGGQGHAFSSDSIYYSKGCYAYSSAGNAKYSNVAFYGTGGTQEDMKKALTLPKYRPIGYDCDSIGTICNELS